MASHEKVEYMIERLDWIAKQGEISYLVTLEYDMIDGLHVVSVATGTLRRHITFTMSFLKIFQERLNRLLFYFWNQKP